MREEKKSVCQMVSNEAGQVKVLGHYLTSIRSSLSLIYNIVLAFSKPKPSLVASAGLELKSRFIFVNKK